MSGPWNKYNLQWRLPDQPVKGGGSHDELDDAQNHSENENNENDQFSFELTKLKTMGVDKAKKQVPSNAQSEDGAEGLASLPVGKPGDFSSRSHEHGVNLSGGDSTPGTATKSAALVMVDEPMPEISSNGASAVQEMFVAEVLKGVEGFGTVVAPAASLNGGRDEIRAAVESENSASGEGSSYSETSGIEPTIFLHTQIDAPLVSELVGSAGQSSETGADLTISTSVSDAHSAVFSVQSNGGHYSSAQEESSSQAGGGISESTKAALMARLMAAEAGRKSGLSPFEGTKIGRRVGHPSQTQALLSGYEHSDVEDSSAPANASLGNNKLPMGVRVALGFFVVSIVLGLSLIVLKQYSVLENETSPVQDVVEKPKSLPKKKSISGSKSKDKSVASSEGKSKATSLSAKSIKKKSHPADESKSKSNPAFSAKNNDQDVDQEAESTTTAKVVLSKPMSRFNVSNSTFSPLTDIAVALDRVQPRKVHNLMKRLSADYGARNLTERAALRELTARYYLQVGAYQKAITLFRQVCSGPSHASEVESCVHAARGILLSGDVEGFRELAEALTARLVGQNNPWQPWIKFLEFAAALPDKTVDSFSQFTDQMIEMAPHMTSEWNLQLSTFFAKNLMTAPHEIKIGYLQTLNGVRRKSLELRLAPTTDVSDTGNHLMTSVVTVLLRHYEMTALNVKSEEPETDSNSSLTSWIFNIIAHSQISEFRQTRARLAPLFGVRTFAPLARVIEGHLAVQAGDFIGASAMINEQVGLALEQRPGVKLVNRDERDESSNNQLLLSLERFKDLPFLHVEWLFLGIKVAAGLNDREMMRPLVNALAGARQRFADLGQDFQYWSLLARGYRVLGSVSGVEGANKEAGRLAQSLHEKGFVLADNVWLLMKRGQRAEAKALLRRAIREIPHHARILEVGAEFAGQWYEDPTSYLKMESEIPKRFETRGRDRDVLSFYTMQNLLKKL